MIEQIKEISIQSKARIAGIIYLMVIIGGIFAVGYVPVTLIDYGDAAATAQNILANESLYRLSLSVHVIIVLLNVPLIVVFYDVFKIANKSLARMVVLFILVAATIEGINLFNKFMPLLLLQDAAILGLEQVQVQAFTFFLLQDVGVQISFVFVGSYCLLAGYLIFKLGFLPRITGLLLAIGGASYVIYSFANFLAPDFAANLVPYIQIPSFIGEATLTLSLLIKGVNVKQTNTTELNLRRVTKS